MWGQLSTTCSNATELAQLGAPSCNLPQPATDNGARDGRSNWLAVTPFHSQGSTPWAPRIVRCKCGPEITWLAAANGTRTRDHRIVRPTHCLCGYSGWRGVAFIFIFSWIDQSFTLVINSCFILWFRIIALVSPWQEFICRNILSCIYYACMFLEASFKSEWSFCKKTEIFRMRPYLLFYVNLKSWWELWWNYGIQYYNFISS